MVRVLAAFFFLAVLNDMAVADDAPSRHQVVLGVDAGYLDMNGLESWTEGFVGKLRYQDDGVIFSSAFLDYRGRWADTLQAHILLEAYDDDLGPTVGFTQAYLEWRPVPSSANRYRVKFGVFYPRISLENVGAGWRSPYTLNFSAINTWAAEELRSTGAELTVSRRPVSLGGAHTFSASAAAFIANDPAGSLLAWKGWSVHERQSRLSDKLPLPPLPQIQPGMMFENQAPYVEPFVEVDNRVGYYVNADWRYGKKFMLRLMHYDNRADPEVLKDGQYGWTTKFWHLGMQATLPGEIGFIAQAMTGSTVMGPVMNGAHVVDVEYESQFALLSRAFGKHRVSVRYDHFIVTQNDRTPEDNNPENGLAWTLGYRFNASDNISLAAEWLSIKTHHCGWAYYGVNPTATETQAQLMLQVRF